MKKVNWFKRIGMLVILAIMGALFISVVVDSIKAKVCQRATVSYAQEQGCFK